MFICAVQWPRHGNCLSGLEQRGFGSELAVAGIANEHRPGSEIMDC
jgi:hypothetical protein